MLNAINIAKVIRVKAATIHKVKKLQGGSNMNGTCAACLHTNQSRSYLNHLVYEIYPILNEINPVHVQSHFLKIHFHNISHLHLSFPNSLVLSGLRTKIPYGPLLSPEQHSTCQAHHILVDMLAQITFGEEYRSISSLLRSFLHSPVTTLHYPA